jgi:AraC-like DNA-binding protein
MAVSVQTTQDVLPQERAGRWSSVISEAYFPLHLSFRDPAHFCGRLERHRLGQVSLSRLQTEPIQYERRKGHISGSSEEEYLITIPRLAPVEFNQLGREVRCDPGGFILERGDEPYRFAYADTNDLYVLKIARPALSEKLRDPDRFCAQVFNGREGVGGLFTTMARHVMRDAQLADADSSERGTSQILGRHLIELLSLALNAQSDADGGARSAVRGAHLRRAQDVIRQRLSDSDLSPDTVAETCGISKRYLHELFSDANCTVSQYIREQRLIAAREMLELPTSLPIAEIAYRFGFSDQAQFSRLFKAAFNDTPSGYRARARNDA